MSGMSKAKPVLTEGEIRQSKGIGASGMKPNSPPPIPTDEFRQKIALRIDSYKSAIEVVNGSLPEPVIKTQSDIVKLLEDLRVTITMQNKLTSKLLDDLLKL